MPFKFSEEVIANLRKNMMLMQFDFTSPHYKCNKNFSLSAHIYKITLMGINIIQI